MLFTHYIHIPKCAGNSVIQGLVDTRITVEKGHSTYRHYLECRESATHYVATVRNPWDRMVSCYEYFKIEDQTFDQFMQKHAWAMGQGHIHNGRSLKLNTWAAQTHWLTDLKGQLHKSIHILRFEQLQHDFDLLLESWGHAPVALPTLNKSDRRPYSDYYSNKWIEKVRSAHQLDITNFNYKY
jgi:hypothetical protein